MHVSFMTSYGSPPFHTLTRTDWTPTMTEPPAEQAFIKSSYGSVRWPPEPYCNVLCCPAVRIARHIVPAARIHVTNRPFLLRHPARCTSTEPIDILPTMLEFARPFRHPSLCPHTNPVRFPELPRCRSATIQPQPLRSEDPIFSACSFLDTPLW